MYQFRGLRRISLVKPPFFLKGGFFGLHRSFYLSHSELTLPQFNTLLRGCKSCSVRAGASGVVLPEYREYSDILFVGRCPGKLEDRFSSPLYPFSPGGKCFARYLSIMELGREEVSISNCIYCYASKGRSFGESEVVECSKWKLYEYLFLPKVKYIFLMGNDAIRQFMGFSCRSIVSIFGSFFTVSLLGREVLVFPIYHPVFVLRSSYLSSIQDSYLRIAKEIIFKDRKGEFRWGI